MRSRSLKLTAALFFASAFSLSAYAQNNRINVVTTAVPFLRVAPDARSSGMGDIGLATSPDASAGFWNIGKVAFNESKGGLVATYSPWLKDIVNDVYLASLSGFYKIDENSALNLGFRYFNLGDIQFTDDNSNNIGSGRPREFGIDLGYSRRLSSKLGLGVSLRYINSDLAAGVGSGGYTYKVGSAIAGDIGLFYDNKNEAGNGFAFGAQLSNLGTKIAYTDNADARDYIPANLGLGATYTKNFDDKNKITFGIDANKLLVPTPPENLSDPNALNDYRSKAVVGSWFSSFGDAPGGFGEEMREFQLSAGAEYWYNNQFALRAGYFYEDKTKGNRRYFTAGLGLKYNIFGINFSYLAPTGSGVTRIPLSNTIRLSVAFDFGNNAD
ncbi:type IX secretion system outer membrane channel protein PorV [Terrimonas rubra]|uniref:Type IX secretion system outer membrane channel protein PorV n=1 Tax=Terrimonas rubra TaxID=1035890 RepID=A0ABW5ZZC3_9BACT